MPKPIHHQRPALLAALALCACFAVSGVGANPAPAPVPSHVQRYVPDRSAVTQGTLRWFGFHVYDARLYTPVQFDAARYIEQPFVLELTYARKLKGKAIAETSREEIERLGFGSEAQRKRWLDAMLRIFPDVDEGRRIAGVNQPGVGVRFYVDGIFAASVDDPEFARAFFAIWLDERTQAPRLRDALLKRS